jgi:ABC-2 type transport system permease protein
MPSNSKKQNIYSIAVIVISVILLSIISSWYFFRIDLTAEKRHSISPATKALLSEINEPLHITVFLKGDFPPGFTRLSNATREFLDVFCAYNRNVSYEFVNPNAVSDASKRDTLIARLMRKGLNPTTLNVNKDGRTEQQLIFPCALVTYQNKEVTVDLLKSQIGVPAEEVLNNSIEALEFNMAIALRKLTTNRKPAVAFLEGQREADLIRVADAIRSLREYYAVYKVRPDGNPDNFFLIRTDPKTGRQLIEPKFRALIIAKPDSLFTEADKFLIDQYIMYGGKVLWFIDPVSVSMDSVRAKGRTMAYLRDLNLDDQLFRYGVRLNDKLVMDLNALSIPVVTGQMGGQPQQSMLPWYFFPVLMPAQNHPIVKNLNAVKTEFITGIDTVKATGVQKTILLTTSKYSRLVSVPVEISLDMLRIQPDPTTFNKPPQTVAVLLEGQFTSLFRNRIPPVLKDGAKFTALNQSRMTGMLVVSDGDVVMNQVQTSNGRLVPLPLGYDRYSNQIFGNSDLLLNTVNYLCDDAGLVTLRTREVKLRLLDREKIKTHQLAIQIVNVALPVLIIIIIGLLMFWFRRRKYTQLKTSHE